jgi:hypothetical protein
MGESLSFDADDHGVGAYEVFELVDGDRGSAMGLVERTSLYEAKLR